MYRLKEQYKFEIRDKIFYTGLVMEEDALQIRIATIRDEEIILNKKEIIQSKLIEQQRIGDISGKEKRS